MDPEEIQKIIEGLVEKSMSEAEGVLEKETLHALVAQEVAKALESLSKRTEPDDEAGTPVTALELSKAQQDLIDETIKKSVEAAVDAKAKDDEVGAAVMKALQALGVKPADQMTELAKAAQRTAPVGTGNGPSTFNISKAASDTELFAFRPNPASREPMPENQPSLLRILKAQVSGDWSGCDLEKALSSETAEEGGAGVPDPIAARVIEFAHSKMVIERMPGIQQVPMDSETLTFLRDETATTSYWGHPQDEDIRSSATPTLGAMRIVAKDHTAIVQIPNKLIANSSQAVEANVRNRIGRQIATSRDLAWIRGAGGNEPIGIFPYTGVLLPTAVDLADLTGDNLRAATLSIALAEADNMGWAMHPTALDKLNGEKDSNGRPIVNPDPQRADGVVLLGLPVLTSTQCKKADGDYLIFFGQWSEVVIGSNQSLRIDASDQAEFKKDQTVIRAIERVDLGIERPEMMGALEVNA